MTTQEQKQWEKVAKQMHTTNINASEIFLLGLEVLKATGVTKTTGLKKARRLIRLGEEALGKETKTVTFLEAYEDMVNAKANKLRPASMKTMKALLNRILKQNKGLAKKKMRNITTQDCEIILDKSFQTPRQFLNGRAILSSLFSHSSKRGWVDSNPVINVDIPTIKEKKINILKLHECMTLMKLSKIMYHGECFIPAAILLFTGMRPTELTRLKWNDVLLDEGVISLKPNHSKTGGARHISIHRPLKNIIKQQLHNYNPNEKIIPKNWSVKWREIRREFCKQTGITWQADVLRHSFASYYLKCFHNLASLQIEMGHRNLQHLQTRYLNMEGINKKESLIFWGKIKSEKLHTS